VAFYKIIARGAPTVGKLKQLIEKNNISKELDIRPSDTSVGGLKLLAYAAFSYLARGARWLNPSELKRVS